MTDVTDKDDHAIARFERIARNIDEREGPVRAAARRERQRLNTDLARRVKRVGIAIGLVRLITIPLPIPFLGDLALLVGLAGMFAVLLGTAALMRHWFSFFFLVFMVPLPIALYSRLASPLQLLASRVASTVMNATGVPVLCEGNRMTLPGGVQMFVAEACSGLSMGKR